MNKNDENMQSDSENIKDEEIESLVPSKKAYFIGFLTLFLCSTSGGLIGYASSKIFVNDPTLSVEIIFAALSTVLIAWSMSIVVNISLKASVEFRSRKKLFPSKKRPSKLI